MREYESLDLEDALNKFEKANERYHAADKAREDKDLNAPEWEAYWKAARVRNAAFSECVRWVIAL